ncbi:MAG: ketopantoate reductase family protein [Clostridia bacterium]|nr:ketopantoate reductase family protein [Clostridia bacterium]
MKYLVIGAGGTGGPIAAHLNKGGADVAVIARGEHLEAIKQKGLAIKKSDGTVLNERIKVYTEDEYCEKADVIFVTVKSYSVDSVIELIRKASHENTVVIPLLNVFTTGEYLSEKLPELYVVDGTMYIVASIKEPGVISMNADIFRVLFGERKGQRAEKILDLVAEDMLSKGINTTHTSEIRREALLKFSFISPMAAAGVYHKCRAGDMHKEGKERETFVSLVSEVVILAKSMGVEFEESLVERSLRLLDARTPDMISSMQRDVEAGKKSEFDGLIHSVARISKEKNLGLKTYEMISDFGKEIP